jgi:hypothetical protein
MRSRRDHVLAHPSRSSLDDLARTSNRRRLGASLEALEQHNLILVSLFERIAGCRGSSVEERWEYGNCAKEAIRHLADRVAALSDVARATSSIPGLGELSQRLSNHDRAMRGLFDEAGRMSRGVRGMDLNLGKDFDAAFVPLIEMVAIEVRWELDLLIPTLDGALRGGTPGIELHSERFVRHNAPTTLHRAGPRWHERDLLVWRVLTMFDHLRDYPRAARSERRN